MAEDFVLKNVPAEVEAAINRATTSSELRELMLQSMVSAGIAVRTRDDEFDIRMRSDASQVRPATSLPATPAPEKCMRVIYPRGNDRYELYGTSEADLDEKRNAASRHARSVNMN